MLGKFFAQFGSTVGSALGGGILSTIGRFAGRWLGNYLERSMLDPDEHYSISNLKDKFYLQKAAFGEVIPLIFGTSKVKGRIIWATQVKEVLVTKTKKKYFSKSKQIRRLIHRTNCKYYLSFAVAIAEGEIAEISRVWANGKLINIGNYKLGYIWGKKIRCQIR